MTLRQSTSERSFKLLLGLVIAILILRWTLMILMPFGLHGDEAQYWSWSREPDWGYYSKPPLIAWVIAAFTAVFGHAEWAIRLPSALFHGLTTLVIYATAKRAFDERTAFWAALTFYLMPAVWLSSSIISTDVPLLLCWALALNAWVALRERASWPRAIQLGLAIGFGLLAKYAMLFFLPVIALAILLDKPTRTALLSLKGLLALLIVGAIFTPNIIWNLNHDFATLSHTADNANLSGPLFNVGELLTFWGDQFGVFGPLSLPLLIIALLKWRSLPPFAGWCVLLVLTPMTIISFQAFLSRANANWAVTAYIAAPILIALFAVTRPKVLRVLKYGLIGQSVIMVAIGFILLSPSMTDALGLTNSVKRLRAWPATVDTVDSLYQAGHEGKAFTHVTTDNRLVYYGLQYYGLKERSPLYVWSPNAVPNNHAEMTAPLPRTDGPVLILNHYKNYDAYFEESFGRLIPQPPLEIDLGGGETRTLKIWIGYDYVPAAERVQKAKVKDTP